MAKDKFPRLREVTDMIQRDLELSDAEIAERLDLTVRQYRGDNRHWPAQALALAFELIVPSYEYLLGMSEEPFQIPATMRPRDVKGVCGQASEK